MFLLLAWCHDSPDAQTFDLNNSVALASNRMNFVGLKPHRIGSVSFCNTIGHVNNIPTMQFSLEFPEILSQNLICRACLGIPK